MNVVNENLRNGTQPLLDVNLGIRAAYVNDVGSVKEFVTSDRQFRVPMNHLSVRQEKHYIDGFFAKYPDGHLVILKDESGKTGFFCSV